MSKLRLLLGKLGISLTPLQSFVASQWGSSIPTPLVQPGDLETFKTFVDSLFVDDGNESRGSAGAPLNAAFEKKLSTARLVEDVASHIMSRYGSAEDNVLVSGFGHRWVFDGSVENRRRIGRGGGGQSVGDGCRGLAGGGGGGSVFRLEGGTGTESLQYFTTTNWKLLHSRLADDILFRLLATKMMFASCGPRGDLLCQLTGKPVSRLVPQKKKRKGKNKRKRKTNGKRKLNVEAMLEECPAAKRQKRVSPVNANPPFSEFDKRRILSPTSQFQLSLSSRQRLSRPLVSPSSQQLSSRPQSLLSSWQRTLPPQPQTSQRPPTQKLREDGDGDVDDLTPVDAAPAASRCLIPSSSSNRRREKLRLLAVRRKTWRREVASNSGSILAYDAAKQLPRSSFLYCEGRERLPRNFCLREPDVADDDDDDVGEIIGVGGRSSRGYRLAVHIWICTRLEKEANCKPQSRTTTAPQPPLQRRQPEKQQHQQQRQQQPYSSNEHDPRCSYVASSISHRIPSSSSISAIPSLVENTFLSTVSLPLTRMMRKFESLPLASIIDKHCSSMMDRASEEEKIDGGSFSVVELAVQPWRVFLAVKTVIIRLFDGEVGDAGGEVARGRAEKVGESARRFCWWDGKENRQNFFKKLRAYIVDMGRTDVMTLGHLMDGVKVSKVSWAKPLSITVAKERAVAKFLWWVITSIVNVILRSFFYITELDHQPRTKVFYRKRLWQRLRASAYGARFLSSSCLANFSTLTDAEVQSRMSSLSSASSKALGIAGLRFVPKERGLRPILRMGSGGTKINLKLSSALSLLKSRRLGDPEIVGVSVFGRSDFFEKFLRFKKALLRHANEPGGGCVGDKFYCVKLDVKDCYQTIDQPRLCRILEKIIVGRSADEELVQPRYQIVSLAGKIVRLRKSVASLCLKAKSAIPSRTKLVEATRRSEGMYDSIFEDVSSSPVPTPTSLIRDTLVGHIRNTLVKDGRGGVLLMHRGLAAGCAVSSMCCNLYYGDLENNEAIVRQLLDDADSLIVREVDDYLLLTKNLTKARLFLRHFLRGFPNYSMSVKRKKTLTNFPFPLLSFGSASSASSCSSATTSPAVLDARLSEARCSSSSSSCPSSSARTNPVVSRSRDCSNRDLLEPRVSTDIDGNDVPPSPSPWFPWCGFLFHEATLEVRLDLSRYKAPFSTKEMKKSVSLNYDRKRRWTLKDVKSIVASNVKNLGWPLCFSPLVNSRRLRLRNAFDLLFLVYRKLYTMDLQLHQFRHRLHRLEPKEFADMIEMVGLALRSRLESIVRHATKKAFHGGLDGGGSRQDTVEAAEDAPASHRRRCCEERRALTGNGEMAVWLSYEAALTALNPNRGQFIRALKEARRRQKNYEKKTLWKDMKFIRNISGAFKGRFPQ